ncbi:MAG: translational GTPase TypA [Planctomycetes bacterium]|nr:translational GTPase TypA [Planctomycetota bacterium]
MSQARIRNIAIIAHVDHGKTTLVDRLLQAAGAFKVRKGGPTERLLDSNDQERERGITILAKNTAIQWGGTKINIIDTPGHSDFGGEVERVVSMADGCLLLVDAAEGPMPQTRFVLKKALEKKLQPIVVINKIDRPDQRCRQVLDEVFDLFCELTHDDKLLDFPVIWASGRAGYARNEPDDGNMDMTPLFQAILERIPPPPARDQEPPLFQVTLIDHSDYVGRIGIGRIHAGTLQVNQPIAVVKRDGRVVRSRIQELFGFDGTDRVRADRVPCGDICAVVAAEHDLEISDTISDMANPQSLPAIAVEEPTMSMILYVNDSPFAGLEGEYVTSRHLRERLEKELRSNVALRVERGEAGESWRIAGRGVLHLGVFLETMRREGYEFAVGKPRVITKEIDGQKNEPIELLIVDVRTPWAGKVIELVGGRRGEVQVMEASGGTTHLEIAIPARGIVGLRTKLLSATTGEAVLHTSFLGYQPWKGPIGERQGGVQIAVEQGKVADYSLDALQDRGDFFVENGDQVYVGQIVGEHCRGIDIVVNCCKAKKLSNMRSSGADRKMVVAPPKRLSLEECLEYIAEDELVEVTPKSLRMRKILLDEKERKRAKSAQEQSAQQ